MSPRAPAPIRRALALRTAKGRKKACAFLIEGERGVMDALQRSALVVEVLISSALSPRAAGKVRGAARDRSVALHELPPEQLRRVSEVVEPQGIVALARVPEQPAAGAPLLPEGPAMALALDGVRDPGNLGTIVRSAEAAGCSALLLTPGCGDPYNPKIVRAACGSLLNLPPRIATAEAVIDAARKEEAALVLLDVAGGTPLAEFLAPRRMIVVVGGEPRGAGDRFREAAGERLTIPLRGGVESLNAAVAATVALFALRDRSPARKVQR